MKNLARPKAIIAAHFDGISRANEWLDRADNPLPFASASEWRTHWRRIAVRKYQKQPELQALLAEWEHGFDSTLKAAQEYYLAASSGFSVSSRADIIQRLRGQTNAATALLAAIELLPVADQQGILVTCSSIVSAVARDLDALVRGAA